jgi:hypothetical protein
MKINLESTIANKMVNRNINPIFIFSTILDTPNSISASYQEKSHNGAVNVSPDNSKAQSNKPNNAIAHTQDSLVTKSNVQEGTEENSHKRPRKEASTKIVGNY